MRVSPVPIAVAIAPVDVICLAQVSMALARGAVQAKVTVPVLSSPATPVSRLKALLAGLAAAPSPRVSGQRPAER